MHCTQILCNCQARVSFFVICTLMCESIHMIFFFFLLRFFSAGFHLWHYSSSTSQNKQWLDETCIETVGSIILCCCFSFSWNPGQGPRSGNSDSVQGRIPCDGERRQWHRHRKSERWARLQWRCVTILTVTVIGVFFCVQMFFDHDSDWDLMFLMNWDWHCLWCHMLGIFWHCLFPRREAGDVWCFPPVWNLRAVIWSHFAISSLVLLPSHVILSVL